MSDPTGAAEPAPTSIGGVDLEGLASWLDAAGVAGDGVDDPRLLTGGTQNVLLRFERSGRSLVLRRGPRHLRPKSNDTMRREMRVLAALAGTAVPHPELMASCPDDPAWTDGAACYVMAAVDGFNPAAEVPARHAADPDLRHATGLGVVDGIVALGAVDHEAVGLADLGRPDGFLERQVPRWLDELDSYRRHEGYPGAELPAVPDVAAWLEANRPPTFTPGLSHGDYHLANVLVRRDGAELAAIVDWEMCTVGDPLLDLGWLLATWPTADRPNLGGALGAAGGLPDRAELTARYAAGSARDLSRLRWYEVLAGFKLGIILEGTHARACAGKAPPDVGDLLHGEAVALLTAAAELTRA